MSGKQKTRSLEKSESREREQRRYEEYTKFWVSNTHDVAVSCPLMKSHHILAGHITLPGRGRGRGADTLGLSPWLRFMVVSESKPTSSQGMRDCVIE